MHDKYIEMAYEYMKTHGNISVSFIRRKYNLGYDRSHAIWVECLRRRHIEYAKKRWEAEKSYECSENL